MSYSDLAKRLRLPLGFVFGALYLLLARPTPLTLAVGAAIAFIGVAIRGWASGHIDKNMRLATSGPYAHTRNPLYFGSFLIGAGFAIAAHWSLLLIVVAFFAIIYGPTMQQERLRMGDQFPAEFGRYQKNVPAFFPRPTPWRDPEGGEWVPFDFGQYMKHQEWKVALVYVLAVLWLAYRLRPA